MQLRVSTNRKGWQTGGKSSTDQGNLAECREKPTFMQDSARTAFNHNQKLKARASTSLPFLVF
jgi:hypothetical protein